MAWEDLIWIHYVVCGKRHVRFIIGSLSDTSISYRERMMKAILFYIKFLDHCPHEDIRFHLYTPRVRSGIEVDIMKPATFKSAGFIPQHDTCLVIHGFNGTQKSKHIRYLIDGTLKSTDIFSFFLAIKRLITFQLMFIENLMWSL